MSCLNCSRILESLSSDMLPFFEKGDMETLLPAMAERGEIYDVINIDLYWIW